MSTTPTTIAPPRGCALPAPRRVRDWVWHDAEIVILDPSEWTDITPPAWAVEAAKGMHQ
jgi:hypothetical protein